ncbi:MAG: acyltransferase [Paludibacteraceae bacterium]
MTNTISRINWLDSLRAIAVIAVIIIHVSTPVVNMAYSSNMFHWWVGNIFDSAVRFAVPLFLMISGATLLSKEYKLNEFYKKRFVRVLLPFPFWMIVYWIFRFATLPGKQPQGVHDIFNWAISIFMKEGISKHFWYIYMIIFLYLITPIIGSYIRKLKPEMLFFQLLAWVLIISITKDFSVNMYGWSGNLLPKFLTYLLYSGYMVLGYYLYNIFYVSKNIRLTAWILYLITVCIAVLMTYYTSKLKGKLDLSIYNYFSLNTLIQTAAIFIALKETSVSQSLTGKFQKNISKYSYGIYLVHILVIGIFFNLKIFWTMANPLLSVPLIVIMTLITSFIIIFILHKIPYGKYISG